MLASTKLRRRLLSESSESCATLADSEMLISASDRLSPWRAVDARVLVKVVIVSNFSSMTGIIEAFICPRNLSFWQIQSANYRVVQIN